MSHALDDKVVDLMLETGSAKVDAGKTMSSRGRHGKFMGQLVPKGFSECNNFATIGNELLLGQNLSSYDPFGNAAEYRPSN